MENKSLAATSNTETITISRAEYDTLNGQISELSHQVQYLLEQMRLARKKQYGSSSEQSKYDGGEQLSLFNEAEFFADESPEPELTEVEKHYRKKRSETKDCLPENLPVETVECFLPEDEQSCPKCSGPLHIMGKEVVRRELKIIPASVSVVEYVRYTYSCRSCEKNGIDVPVMKAPVKKPVIKGGFASPEAVAHIATQKFVMASPLYRQEKELNRSGIMLSRQTMSNWLLKSAGDWLRPIYNRLHELLLQRAVLHADETTLQVLHEDGKKAQAQRATCGCTGQAVTRIDPSCCTITGLTGRQGMPRNSLMVFPATFMRTATRATISCRETSLWWAAGRTPGVSLTRH